LTVPRPLLECVGGPLDGESLFLPSGERKTVVVPARSCGVSIRWVRMLVGMGCPNVRRVGVYKAIWHPTGDPVFVWLGEGT
jgi:hypothetical protein